MPSRGGYRPWLRPPVRRDWPDRGGICTLHSAVTVLQVYEAGTVGGGVLVKVDAAAGS